jgi:uncharacterized protein YjiS (DUF1127 family)
MTAFDHRLDPTVGRFGAPIVRTRSALGRRLRAGLKRLQYGQMVSVLNRLPDSYLAEAGLRRRDIPAHARQAVYGDD